MLRVVLVLLGIGVTIYGIIDVLRTPGRESRTLPKWLWFVISLIPVLGVVAWFLFGRPVRRRKALGRRGRGPVAPDDDPAFLRQLEQDAWAKRMEERRRSGPDRPATGGGPAPQPAPEPPTAHGSSEAAGPEADTPTA